MVYNSYMSAELSGVSEEIHGVIASYCLSNECLKTNRENAYFLC